MDRARDNGSKLGVREEMSHITLITNGSAKTCEFWVPTRPKKGGRSFERTLDMLSKGYFVLISFLEVDRLIHPIMTNLSTTMDRTVHWISLLTPSHKNKNQFFLRFLILRT
jgi:hypothetical protein